MSGGFQIPEDREWDGIRLEDLYRQFGGLDKVRDTHSTEVIREIAGEANRLMRCSAKVVASKLRQRAVITEQQWLELTSDRVVGIDVANKLLRYFQHAAGLSYFQKTLPGHLYCAFLDTFEEDPSLVNHHYFAVNVIRPKVLQNLKVTGAKERAQVQVQKVAKKVPSLKLQPTRAQQLKRALNVQNCSSDDLGEITRAFCASSHGTSLPKVGCLLEAFLCTKGLGRHVHGWLSYCHSNGPTVFRFFQNLGDQWKKLLHYYGFTEAEVHSISFYSGDDDREGITALLKVFWIPTANVERVDEILEKSKRSAGITTRARGPNTRAIMPSGSSVVMSSENASQFLEFLTQAATVTNTAMLSLPTASSSHRESPQMVQRAIEYVGPEHQHLQSPPIAEVFPSETSSSCVSGDESPTTSELLSACKQHNEKKALEQIEATDSLSDSRDKDGKNALMHACMGSMMTVVKCLIQRGADLSAVDRNGECCLHFTETLRDIHLLEMLLKEYKRAKVSVDLPSQSGWTPLGKACVYGTYQAAEILIDAGANPEGNIKGNCCPLLEVCARGKTKHVRLLLSKGVSPNLKNKHRNTPLLQAVRSQQWEVAIILLDAGADPNRTDIHAVSALFYAIKENSLETIRKLIERNANVNATRMVNGAFGASMNESALSLACAMGHRDIVDLLVDCGADLHFLCGGIMPPIGFAVLFNHVEVVKLLLAKAQMDKSIDMLAAPIKAAVQAMHIKCAEILLNELGGADKALQKAQESSLHNLVEHITTFKIVKEAGVGTCEDRRIGDDLLSPSQGRVLQIMHKFCQICVSCITSIPETKRDELLKLAESCNACEAAIFLRQCYSDNQEQENLHRDFLHGNPSPFQFLVQNGLLTAENFQVEVWFQYGDDGQKFCTDLVWAFKQIQGAEGLPDNVEFILQRVFSGHCHLGVMIGVRDIHGARILPGEIPENAPYPWNILRTADHGIETPFVGTRSLPHQHKLNGSSTASVPIQSAKPAQVKTRSRAESDKEPPRCAPPRQASSGSQKKEKSNASQSMSNEAVQRHTAVSTTDTHQTSRDLPEAIIRQPNAIGSPFFGLDYFSKYDQFVNFSPQRTNPSLKENESESRAAQPEVSEAGAPSPSKLVFSMNASNLEMLKELEHICRKKCKEGGFSKIEVQLQFLFD